MYHHFAQKPTLRPKRALLLIFFLTEKRVFTSPHSINLLVFISQLQCVYCAVRAEHLNRPVYKYSFVNRTAKSWNQLPASLLASFPCKLNTLRKRVKNVVTSKGIQVEIECK
jgi:hypothetical protein